MATHQNDAPTGRNLTRYEEKQEAEAQGVKELVKSSPAYQHQVALREAAKLIRSTVWGKAISPAEQAAVAQYCVSIGADPVRHVTLFGGNVFLNAEYYMETSAGANPNAAVELDDILEDPRARAKWGVPEFAKAAYVAKFWRNREDRNAGFSPDFEECNWAPRTMAKNDYNKNLDQVGIDNPHKTARTRTMRRLLRLVTPIMATQVAEVEEKLRLAHEQAKASLQAGSVHAGTIEGVPVPHERIPQQQDYEGPESSPSEEPGEPEGPTLEQRERIERLLTSGHLTANETARINAGLEEGRSIPWWDAALKLYESVVADRQDGGSEED